MGSHIWFRVEVAASPPFLLGDARKWYFSHGLPVITTIRVGPWRRAAPKAQDDPRSGVKNYVRLPVSLKRHPDRSGGILPADR